MAGATRTSQIGENRIPVVKLLPNRRTDAGQASLECCFESKQVQGPLDVCSVGKQLPCFAWCLKSASSQGQGIKSRVEQCLRTSIWEKWCSRDKQFESPNSFPCSWSTPNKGLTILFDTPTPHPATKWQHPRTKSWQKLMDPGLKQMIPCHISSTRA